MKVLLLFVAFVFPISLSAQSSDALESFLRDTRTLTANFTQTQVDERGAVTAKQTGQLWLERAAKGTGKFRWDYRMPYVQEMVCDGERLWLYDPDLAQVTVRPAAETLGGTPAALLLRGRGLSDDFNITPREGGGYALTPKAAESDFQSIELWLDGGAPTRMKFYDQLGGITEVVFTDRERNVKIPAARFAFTPPKGVEVVSGG